MTKNSSDKSQKCYNSISCILSVLIIITVVVSILWTQFVTMPNFEHKLDDTRSEISNIKSMLDHQMHKDSLLILPSDDTISFSTEIIQDK